MPALRAPLIALLAVAAVLAGCAAKEAPASVTEGAQAKPARYADGEVLVDVPVRVVLVGFANATAGALQAQLEPTEVRHETYNFAFEFPFDPLSAPPSAGVPLALVPRAVFEVVSLPDAAADMLAGELAAAAEDGLWSANLAEDRLAELLPEAGHPLDQSAPTLVLLHLDAPGYRYRQTTGWLDNVRVFGERVPLLALDVSAPTDPFAGDGESYGRPLPGTPDAAPALAEAVQDAVRFRLLQGPIYPVTLQECHAVTLVVAARAASIAEVAEGRYADAVDGGALREAWENATAGVVHVDVSSILLPVGDPGLDAALRAASAGAPGGLDTLRQWAAMNWDQYWVPHDGCEPYVSFLVVGDAGDDSLFGIAMYDVAEGHRTSLSVVPDVVRLQEGFDGPLSPLNPTEESRESPNWANFLFAHETGHLLGQRHPHDVSLAGGDFDFTFAWSSVWTSMTYESADRLVGFGAMDQNNHVRNRAAQALQQVLADGGEPSPDVLRLLGERQWDAATDAMLA